MVNNWLNIIQDFWLPPTCLLCNSPGHNRWDICYDCYTELPWLRRACLQCAITLPEDSPLDIPCGECQQRPPAFDQTSAVFKHEQAIRYLITHLKFNAQFKHARLLGLLLAEALAQAPARPEAIIPMPLHPKRFQERGFNQSIEIAHTVAKQLQLPLYLNYCVRHRNTPHQTNLTRTERLKNMHNSFSVRKPIPAQHVAILDDVMTTGSTLNELAVVLKNAGVQRVEAWVCARAV